MKNIREKIRPFPYLQPPRSEAWENARLGKITASAVPHLLYSYKNRQTKIVMLQILLEKAIKKVVRGKDKQRYARDISANTPRALLQYKERTDNSVELRGFTHHPKYKLAGASVDAFAIPGVNSKDMGKESGVVEVFICHQRSYAERIRQYMDTSIEKAIGDRKYAKIQFILDCTGCTWCDYVVHNHYSRDDERRKDIDFIIRVNRDEKFIKEMWDKLTPYMEIIRAQ